MIRGGAARSPFSFALAGSIGSTACPLVEVLHILCDHAAKQAAGFPGRQHLVGAVGLRSAEVVVEDVFQDWPGHFRPLEEIPDLEQPGVVLRPQAALAAEGRDAAFHRDARAREGGQVAGAADKCGGGADCYMGIGRGLRAFHQVTTCREGG